MDILENNKLFRRIGFIQHTTIKLKTDGDEFRKRFFEHIGTEINSFGISNHNKSLHGELKNKAFKIYIRIER